MINGKPRYARPSKCSGCKHELLLSNIREHQHLCDACHREITRMHTQGAQSATEYNAKRAPARQTTRITPTLKLEELSLDELLDLLEGLK